jgi:hypothetical protein
MGVYRLHHLHRCRDAKWWETFRCSVSGQSLLVAHATRSNSESCVPQLTEDLSTEVMRGSTTVSHVAKLAIDFSLSARSPNLGAFGGGGVPSLARFAHVVSASSVSVACLICETSGSLSSVV